MSLRVWLPLNGNLNNQGLSDITVTNNGATVDNNGKIGKCYYFDGNAHYLQFSKSVGDLYSGDFSYAVWLKPMDDTRSVICSEYASSGASNIAFELSASRQVRLYWDGSPDISSTGCILPKSQWTHIVITRSGNEAKFYMNGELKYTYTGTLSNKTSTAKIRLGDDYRGGTGVSYMGYMNDFRLYDHALSPKEVEILSRGLVCHYPLNNNGGGQPNLYDFESDANKWVGDGLTRVNYIDSTYGNVIKATAPSTLSSLSRIYREVSNVWTAGQTYTVSFLARASKTITVKASRSTGDFAPDFTVGTEWKRYVGIINCTTTAAGGTLSIQNITVSSDLYITQIKLELGDKATAYCPGVGDSHYIPLGYDSTTIYDCSGYQNNGTVNGSLTVSSDTVRYSVSTYVPKAGYIQHPNALGTDNANQEWTCCAWVKLTGTDSSQYLNNFNLANIIRASTTPLLYINSGSHDYYMYGSVALSTDTWTHIAFVFKNSTGLRNVYINGELKNGYGPNKDSTPAGIPSTITVFGGNFNGYVSDYREYATALSADQIKELYNTAVSVANNGTLMGYELVEV